MRPTRQSAWRRACWCCCVLSARLRGARAAGSSSAPAPAMWHSRPSCASALSLCRGILKPAMRGRSAAGCCCSAVPTTSRVSFLSASALVSRIPRTTLHGNIASGCSAGCLSRRLLASLRGARLGFGGTFLIMQVSTTAKLCSSGCTKVAVCVLPSIDVRDASSGASSSGWQRT
jgi:hypothetical protein